MKKSLSILIGALIILCLPLLGFAQSETNLLENGSLEIVEPGFWNKFNDGVGNSAVAWDITAGYNSMRSIKIVKPEVTTMEVGYASDNNAQLYWNGAKADRLYNLIFYAKTENVNTNPGTDDAKIGVLFIFYANGTVVGEEFVPVDQTNASSDWTEYTSGLYIPAGDDPDEMYAVCKFGKDATGTVWFDNVDCGTDPWAMGVFNGNFEVAKGWMEWHSMVDGVDEAYCNTVNDVSYDGDWSVLLHEWDNNGDEMVFYSVPAPAEPNTWYKISVMAKWDTVNTDDRYLPTTAVFDRDDNRVGMCFFYHKAPILKSWDLTGGGDQFFYFDQRVAMSDGWVQYSVVSKSPEDAAGLSVRARFTSYPVGKVWYDDFKVEKIVPDENILVNGDLETEEPGFWNAVSNNGILTWDPENGINGSRCVKIEKAAAGTDAVYWKSDNNAQLYWNGAAAERLYNLIANVKTENVNTNPATDDAKIGVLFSFFANGTLVGEEFVAVDQSAASTDWTEYTSGLYIPAGDAPDEMYATLWMGKDATGTVWFDNVDCGTDPWAMGLFNGNFEVAKGWMEWHATIDGADQAYCNTVNDVSYEGDYSVLLHEWDDNDDEMVFYSIPVPAEPNEWYMVSVMAKTDSVNIDEAYFPSNVVFDRDNNRLGMCFFYHKAPILNSWDLTGGGDQFYYFDQRVEMSEDWVQYKIISKAPEDAAGISVRARFTSYCVGKVWYDNFAVHPVEISQLPTGVRETSNYATIDIPQEFALGQNYPNPFNPVTTILYTTPKDGDISVEVYNVLGKKIKTLFTGYQQAGNHEIQWDGLDDSGAQMASGVYFVTLRSGQFVTAKRMTLMK
ncbi:T9SS type A sorting domain-containing protein [candidate division KSB1 bacterium]|nr:T9SS type A sorting domain-containing protein [candidate division KSB1 bacterium]